jgi:hypothetical protein
VGSQILKVSSHPGFAVNTPHDAFEEGKESPKVNAGKLSTPLSTSQAATSPPPTISDTVEASGLLESLHT